MKQRHTPILWIVFLVIIAVLVVGMLLTSPAPVANGPEGESALLEDMTPRESTFASMLLVGDSGIYVEDQTAGNDEVLVAVAILENPGFVVVFDDRDGVPDDVIGVSELIVDNGENFVVEVEDLLEDSEVYYAVLYEDDGDGIWNVRKDRAVTDPDENTIMMSFVAQDVEIEEEEVEI